MKKDIKAIPTEYKGVRFKSRLEARWAIFLDQIGYDWHYEAIKHTTETPTPLIYIPDFYCEDRDLIIEIKHSNYEPTHIDIEKWCDITRNTDQIYMIVFFGEPVVKSRSLDLYYKKDIGCNNAGCGGCPCSLKMKNIGNCPHFYLIEGMDITESKFMDSWGLISTDKIRAASHYATSYRF